MKCLPRGPLDPSALLSSISDINYSNIDFNTPLQNYMLRFDPTSCKPRSFSPAGVNPDDQTLSFDCLTNELTISDGNTVGLPTYCISFVGGLLTLTQTCDGNTTDVCSVNIPDLDVQQLSFDCPSGILSLTGSPDVDLGACFQSSISVLDTNTIDLDFTNDVLTANVKLCNTTPSIPTDCSSEVLFHVDPTCGIRAYVPVPTAVTKNDFTLFLGATFDLNTDLDQEFVNDTCGKHYFISIDTSVNDVDIINETAAPAWIKDGDTVTFEKFNPFGFDMTHTNFPGNQPIVANVQGDTITLMRSASAGKRKLFM